MERALQRRLAEYAARFAADFPRSKPARWSAIYLQGLLLERTRKTVEAMARRVVLPPDLRSKTPDQALQQFVNQSYWDEQPILRHYRAIMAEAFPVTDGAIVIHDICFPKQGHRSVGVARQYCELVRRPANCQVAVAAHHVSRTVSYPLALRLYLPDSWLADSRWLDEAGVPVRERRSLSRQQIGLNLLDRLRSEGFSGCVIAPEEYGDFDAFRHALDRRGLSFIVAVRPQEIRLNHGLLEEHAQTIAWTPPAQLWRQARPRQAIGTFSWLPHSVKEQRLTGGSNEADLFSVLAAAQPDGTWRLAVSNVSPTTPGVSVVELWESLAAAEEDYRLLRERVGLSHFEGRSWRGFHHHACMVFLAFGFLALERQRRDARAARRKVEQRIPRK